jgi:hypothetical protein
MFNYRYRIQTITTHTDVLVHGKALEYAIEEDVKEADALRKFLQPRGNMLGEPVFRKRGREWEEDWPPDLESRARLRYGRNIFSELGEVLGPRLTLLADMIPVEQREEKINYMYYMKLVAESAANPAEWVDNVKELWTWAKGRWVIKGWHYLNVARLAGFGWFKNKLEETNFIYEEVKVNYVDRGPERMVLGSANLFQEMYEKAIFDEYNSVSSAASEEKQDYMTGLTYRGFIQKPGLWATTGAADGSATKIWYEGKEYKSVRTKWSVSGGQSLQKLLRQLDVNSVLGDGMLVAAVVRIFIKYEEQLKRRIVAADELRRYMIDSYVNYFIADMLPQLPSVVTFWSNTQKYSAYLEICTLVTEYVSAALDYAGFDKTQTYAQMNGWARARAAVLKKKLGGVLSDKHDFWKVLSAQSKILTESKWDGIHEGKVTRLKFTKSLASGQRVTAEFGGVSNMAQLKVAALMLGFKGIGELVKSFHQGDDTASWMRSLSTVTDIGICLNSSGSEINGLKAVITDTASKTDESMFTEFLSNIFYSDRVVGYPGRALLKLFEAAPANAASTPKTDQITRVTGICNTLIGRGANRDLIENLMIRECSIIFGVSLQKALLILRTPRAIGGLGWNAERKGKGIVVRVKDETEYVPMLVRGSPLYNDYIAAKRRTGLIGRRRPNPVEKTVVYGFPTSGKTTLKTRIGSGEDTDDGPISDEAELIFTNLHDYVRKLRTQGWKVIALTPPTESELFERLEARDDLGDFERLRGYLRGNDYKDLTNKSVSVDKAYNILEREGHTHVKVDFSTKLRSLIIPNQNLSKIEYITEDVEWDISGESKLLSGVGPPDLLKPIFKLSEDNVFRDDIFQRFIERREKYKAREMLTEKSKAIFDRWASRENGIKASNAFFNKWTKGISSSVPSDNLSNPVELGMIGDRLNSMVSGRLSYLREPSTGHLREILLYSELVWFSIVKENVRVENRISMSP